MYRPVILVTVNSKFPMGLIALVLGATLSSCFPRATVQKSELNASSMYRNQNIQFNCDPARTAIDQGLPLDLNERPLSFGCRATNSDSIITVTIEPEDKNSNTRVRVLWSVQDPVSGSIVTLDSRRASFSSVSNNTSILLNRGYDGASFEFKWSDFAVIKGSFRLEAP
jgi:hypothetical protein